MFPFLNKDITILKMLSWLPGINFEVIRSVNWVHDTGIAPFNKVLSLFVIAFEGCGYHAPPFDLEWLRDFEFFVVHSIFIFIL